MASVRNSFSNRGAGFYLFQEPTLEPRKAKKEIEPIASAKAGQPVTLIVVNSISGRFGGTRNYVLQLTTDYKKELEKKRNRKNRK